MKIKNHAHNVDAIRIVPKTLESGFIAFKVWGRVDISKHGIAGMCKKTKEATEDQWKLPVTHSSEVITIHLMGACNCMK